MVNFSDLISCCIKINLTIGVNLLIPYLRHIFHYCFSWYNLSEQRWLDLFIAALSWFNTLLAFRHFLLHLNCWITSHVNIFQWNASWSNVVIMNKLTDQTFQNIYWCETQLYLFTQLIVVSSVIAQVVIFKNNICWNY